MKTKSLILLALCANLPMLAQAPDALTLTKGDASVTLYGILDAGVAKVSHSVSYDPYHPVAINPTLTKPGSASATGMYNGGISQTRIGFKGGLGFSEGWKAVFNLESAINIPSGNLSNAAESLALNKGTGPGMSADSAVAGQLFGRNANFGLSSTTYGTLTLGRHTSLMLDYIPAFDALQGAQLFTPIGFSGIYGGGGATDASRLDSCLKYNGKFSGLSLSALYKFGGVAGSSSAKGATEVAAAYEVGGFTIMAAYQSVTDATAVGNPAGVVNTPTAATANGTAVYQPMGTITLTCEDTKATMLALNYKTGIWGFFAGYQKLAYTNPSNPTVDAATTSLDGYGVGTMWENGATVQAVNVTPFTVGGAAMEKDLTVSWLGAKVALTPKTTFAVSYYNVAQNDFSNGTATAADQSGSTHYTSALLDYNLAKALDAYVGYMGVKGSGGMATSAWAYNTNATLGVGLRYKF